jgi:hypothetical protein
MKNQNDLIVSIVAIVVALGVSLGFFFNKRVPVKPPEPAPVPTAEAKGAEGSVTFANSLPGGDREAGSGGGPGGAPGGRGGGRVALAGAS